MMTGTLGNRDFDTDKIQALKDFITEALTLAQPTGILSFELGNEYQADMNGVEYGRIASSVARIVQEAIDAFADSPAAGPQFEEPDIEVQIWGAAPNRTDASLYQQNENVLAQFEAAELAAVDGVVSPFYFNEDRHD